MAQLNIKQIMAGFNTSDMTVYTWRQGTATRRALPHNVGEGRRVSFDEPEVKAWAKEYGLKFDSAAAKAANSVSVPGPKPKKMVAKKATPAKRARPRAKAS